jgi:predicted transcriptional regulator
MADRRYELGDAELEVLSVLWDSGPCTVRQVLEHLREAGRRVAYTTVLTFLTRMEQKGVVESDKTGIAYVYRASVTRDRYRRSRLKSLMGQLYGGEAAPLVLQLMKTQRFSKEEIAALRKLIKELDAKNKQ